MVSFGGLGTPLPNPKILTPKGRLSELKQHIIINTIITILNIITNIIITMIINIINIFVTMIINIIM